MDMFFMVLGQSLVQIDDTKSGVLSKILFKVFGASAYALHVFFFFFFFFFFVFFFLLLLLLLLFYSVKRLFQDYFGSYEMVQSVGGTKTGEPREKTPGRTWLVSALHVLRFVSIELVRCITYLELLENNSKPANFFYFYFFSKI